KGLRRQRVKAGKPHQPAVHVRQDVAVEVFQRCAESRVDIFRAEQSLETGIPRFTRQEIVLCSVGETAQTASYGAVNSIANEIRVLMIGVLIGLWAADSKNLLHVKRRALQHNICGCEGAYIASRAGERHPGRRHIVARWGGQGESAVVGAES